MVIFPITALAMRVKGGFRWHGKEVPHGRAISTVLVGVSVGLIEMNALKGLAMAVAWYLACVPEVGDKLAVLQVNFRKGLLPLVLRGAVFGLLIGVATMSPWPLVGSLLMPFCYKIGFLLEERWPNTFRKQRNISGWAMGEWLFGACLGVI